MNNDVVSIPPNYPTSTTTPPDPLTHTKQRKAFHVCFGRREVCTDIIENRSLRAYLATTSVVSCGHAGVGVNVGKYDGPMI